jgi:CRISPR/Cas system-associated exonuclease Cas4 (RecB family)
MDAGRL